MLIDCPHTASLSRTPRPRLLLHCCLLLRLLHACMQVCMRQRRVPNKHSFFVGWFAPLSLPKHSSLASLSPAGPVGCCNPPSVGSAYMFADGVLRVACVCCAIHSYRRTYIHACVILASFISSAVSRLFGCCLSFSFRWLFVFSFRLVLSGGGVGVHAHTFIRACPHFQSIDPIRELLKKSRKS